MQTVFRIRITLQRAGRRAWLALGVVALLVGGIGMAWQVGPPPAPAAPAATTEGAALAEHVLFADVDGWYHVTRYERVVASPYELWLTNLPAALPTRIGEWTATDLPVNPQLTDAYQNPELVLQRAYRNPAGDVVWLTFIGHRGPRSFRLFEHTPTICYPLQGWTMLEDRVDTVPLDGGTLNVQRGLARNEDDGQEIVVLYWYLWDTPDRDPKDGILSVRLSAFVTKSEDDAVTLLKRDFIPQLFPAIVPTWHRF
ncbi:MAG: EpsI family protein [Anaerolineae bacterium]